MLSYCQSQAVISTNRSAGGIRRSRMVVYVAVIIGVLFIATPLLVTYRNHANDRAVLAAISEVSMQDWQPGRIGRWMDRIIGWHPHWMTRVTEVRAVDQIIDDALFKRICGMTALVELNVHYNPISDMAGEHVARLTNLEVLDMQVTQVGDRTARALAGLKHLRELYIDATSVTGAGLHDLARIQQLRVLAINNMETPLTDDDIAPLVALASLERLRLNNSKLSDQSIPILIALTSLRRLEIDNTNISVEGVEQLLQGLPHLKQLNVANSKAFVTTDRARFEALTSQYSHVQINHDFLYTDEAIPIWN